MLERPRQGLPILMQTETVGILLWSVDQVDKVLTLETTNEHAVTISDPPSRWS
jgi:hypothetical protein